MIYWYILWTYSCTFFMDPKRWRCPDETLWGNKHGSNSHDFRITTLSVGSWFQESVFAQFVWYHQSASSCVTVHYVMIVENIHRFYMCVSNPWHVDSIVVCVSFYCVEKICSLLPFQACARFYEARVRKRRNVSPDFLYLLLPVLLFKTTFLLLVMSHIWTVVLY